MSDEYLVSKTVPIDYDCRRKDLPVEWFLKDRKSIPISYGDNLQFFICGEESFGHIADDLSAARSTVDLTCWGFDPGMGLKRTSDQWKEEESLGYLIEKITKRTNNPVTVRLLVWYKKGPAAWRQNNMPGFTEPFSWLWDIMPGFRSEREKYCRSWWQRNRPNRVGENTLLQIVTREMPQLEAVSSLRTYPEEKDKPDKILFHPADEQSLLQHYGTHHQKTILIDYGFEEGAHAVGYVMGLNFISAYWDRKEHQLDDRLREEYDSESQENEADFEVESQGLLSEEISQNLYQRAKPYRDYACRIEGPSLQSVYKNFEWSWNKNIKTHPKFRTLEIGGLPKQIARNVASNPDYGVQVVLTQPEYSKKSIKELYFQVVKNARNYIYIENQYFFYPEFARHIKKIREDFCDAWIKEPGCSTSEVPQLFLYVVIPHPEIKEMIPRTFDMLTELGHHDAVPNQRELVDAGAIPQNYENARIQKNGKKVLDRSSLAKLRNTAGLHICVARLRTSGYMTLRGFSMDQPYYMAYREIYIHSKLMIIDDVFLTLGSANINMRSMSVDSELNIAANGLNRAKPLRENIFSMLSGGKIAGGGYGK